MSRDEIFYWNWWWHMRNVKKGMWINAVKKVWNPLTKLFCLAYSQHELNIFWFWCNKHKENWHSLLCHSPTDIFVLFERVIDLFFVIVHPFLCLKFLILHLSPYLCLVYLLDCCRVWTPQRKFLQRAGFCYRRRCTALFTIDMSY